VIQPFPKLPLIKILIFRKVQPTLYYTPLENNAKCKKGSVDPYSHPNFPQYPHNESINIEKRLANTSLGFILRINP
jgi:hypothetical protein